LIFLTPEDPKWFLSAKKIRKNYDSSLNYSYSPLIDLNKSSPSKITSLSRNSGTKSTMRITSMLASKSFTNRLRGTNRPWSYKKPGSRLKKKLPNKAPRLVFLPKFHPSKLIVRRKLLKYLISLFDFLRTNLKIASLRIAIRLLQKLISKSSE
jgi:hypothetical protein